MSAYTEALAATLYGILSGLSSAQTVTSVYPQTTNAADYPMIYIGPWDITPDTLKDGDGGSEDYIDLHFYDYSVTSKVAIIRLMQAAYTALHNQSLTVAGRTSALCWVDRQRIMDTNQDANVHAIMTIKIIHRS